MPRLCAAAHFGTGGAVPPPLLVVPPPFSWPLFPSPAIPARRPSPKTRAAARNSAGKNGNAFFAISAIPLLRRSGSGKRLGVRFPAENQKLRKNSTYMFSSVRQFSRFPPGGKSEPKTNGVPDAATPYPFPFVAGAFKFPRRQFEISPLYRVVRFEEKNRTFEEKPILGDFRKGRSWGCARALQAV